MMEIGKVCSVSRSSEHGFSKGVCASIELIEGVGVVGDAHAGATVKHRSRVAIDPTQPNLRQVHFIASELLDELKDKGFSLSLGDLGENILTEGIQLLDLPKDTLLKIGSEAVVRVTGLRNPCKQIENFRSGLLAAVLDKDENGGVVRKAGVMGTVEVGGMVALEDPIQIEYPSQPHVPLDRV